MYGLLACDIMENGEDMKLRREPVSDLGANQGIYFKRVNMQQWSMLSRPTNKILDNLQRKASKMIS